MTIIPRVGFSSFRSDILIAIETFGKDNERCSTPQQFELGRFSSFPSTQDDYLEEVRGRDLEK